MGSIGFFLNEGLTHPEPQPNFIRTLTLRTRDSDQEASSCAEFQSGDIIIPRTTFIISITVCLALISASWLALAVLLIRVSARRRRANAAKQWGRKSRFDARISMMRKEVDMEYSRQYSGCLQHPPENPCMGSDDAVEMPHPEDQIWEAPAVPPKTITIAEPTISKEKRANKGVSMFFDNMSNLWISKNRQSVYSVSNLARHHEMLVV